MEISRDVYFLDLNGKINLDSTGVRFYQARVGKDTKFSVLGSRYKPVGLGRETTNTLLW